MQPSRTATVCEVDRARKRAASRLEGSEPRIPDKPLETYHPETNRLTATCSCEDCSAFTRVAARTLARSPICDQLHRRLQPFRYLHDCSGCFRLERLAGRGLHPLESAALSRRTREADVFGSVRSDNRPASWLMGPRMFGARFHKKVNGAYAVPRCWLFWLEYAKCARTAARQDS